MDVRQVTSLDDFLHLLSNLEHVILDVGHILIGNQNLELKYQKMLREMKYHAEYTGYEIAKLVDVIRREHEHE